MNKINRVVIIIFSFGFFIGCKKNIDDQDVFEWNAVKTVFALAARVLFFGPYGWYNREILISIYDVRWSGWVSLGDEVTSLLHSVEAAYLLQDRLCQAQRRENYWITIA